jgi:hypothetical protein
VRRSLELRYSEVPDKATAGEARARALAAPREREPAHGGNPRSPQTSTGANPWRQWFNTSELDQLLEDVGPFFSMPADLARDHLE